MHFLDDSLFPENQEKLVITAAPYGPEWEPADFPEDLPLTMDEHVQKAVDCYEAGATVLHIHVRELDGKGSKRLSQVQRAARPPARGRAGHDPAGRRLDLLRPGGRGRGRQVAVGRHPAHARRARPEARPGDHRDQHQPDEHRRADDRRRHRRHLVRAPGAVRGLPRDDRPGRPGLGRGAPAAAAAPTASSRTSSSPTSAQLETRGAAGPPRRLHRPAEPHLGGDRRRLRRPQPVQHDGVHPPGAGRRGADARDHRCATSCRSTRWPSPWACTPAAATRTPSGASTGEKMHLGRSRSSSWCASPASSAARSPPARKPATSTRSASTTAAPTRPWPSSATRPTAARASSASPSTPVPPRNGVGCGRPPHPTPFSLPRLGPYLAQTLSGSDMHYSSVRTPRLWPRAGRPDLRAFLYLEPAGLPEPASSDWRRPRERGCRHRAGTARSRRGPLADPLAAAATRCRARPRRLGATSPSLVARSPPEAVRRGGAGAGGHRRAQRRRADHRALGGPARPARSAGRSSPPRRICPPPLPPDTRRWRTSRRTAGSRCRGRRCPSPASSPPAPTTRSAISPSCVASHTRGAAGPPTSATSATSTPPRATANGRRATEPLDRTATRRPEAALMTLNLATLLEDSARQHPTATRSCSATPGSPTPQVDGAANQVANLLVGAGIAARRQGRAVLPEPAVLPDRLLRHPQGRRGRRAAQRAAEGPRDRLPPRRLRGEGVLLLRGHAGAADGRRGHGRASTQADGCEHFFVITADPAAPSPIEGARDARRGAGRPARRVRDGRDRGDRHRGHPLHQRHDRPAQGRRAHATRNMVLNALDLQPAVRRRAEPARHPPDRRCRCSTPSARPCSMNAGFAVGATLVLLPRFDAEHGAGS